MAATISSAQIRLALVLLLFLAFLPGTVPEPQEGLPDKAVRGLHFSQERSSLRWLDPCNLGIRLSNVTEGHPRIGNYGSDNVGDCQKNQFCCRKL